MKDLVLITGGLGYLGGRIAQELSKAGYRLRLTSRRIPTPEIAATAPAGAELVAMDLFDKASVRDAMLGVDHVVHLAAMNENESEQDPEMALQVNSVGTLRVLKAAEVGGVRRFIYFSTAHIYGAPLVGHLDESTCPRPVHPYAITHKVAEDFVLASGKKSQLEALVVRLSNGFGAPTNPYVNRWTLLVNDLCRQAVNDHRLVLKSAGLQRRDFITLDDVGRAATHLVALNFAACGDGLFNLGGDGSTSILEMAERVAGRCRVVLGRELSIERPNPGPKDHDNDLRFMMDRIKATGFQLHSHIDREIDATLRLCRQVKGA